MFRLSSNKKTYIRIPKTLILVVLQLLLFTHPANAQSRFDGWTLNGEISGTPQFVTVGDKVQITVRAFTQNRTLLTQDKKFTLKIFNPKPGHNCITTDDTLKNDGEIHGICEATGDAGNMEIGVESHEMSTFEVDGVRYSPIITNRYNVSFADPKTSCQGGALAPTSITFTKQNDITVKVEWQNSETFIGSYDVLYGNTPRQYTGKKHTENKNAIIDGLDPRKEYYFKVQAVSACKWTATSALYKYLPQSGVASVTSEKMTSSPSPTTKPTTKVAVKASPSPIATVSAQPVATRSPELELAKSLNLFEKIWETISKFWSKLF